MAGGAARQSRDSNNRTDVHIPTADLPADRRDHMCFPLAEVAALLGVFSGDIRGWMTTRHSIDALTGTTGTFEPCMVHINQKNGILRSERNLAASGFVRRRGAAA
jgi:hypothetical protein